ncbi:hypothetical protein [Pantoea sp. App145]|uniref:hypothetical protein n=1 Tax=Pantoea sp. App145 TaxID=3071567 RepID=UPI003A7FF964
MKKLLMVCSGIALLLIIGGVSLYVDVQLRLQSDLKACKVLTRRQAADAVIADVTRTDRQFYGKYQILSSEIYVDPNSVQIGSGTVLVPFHIAADPDRQYFGMPHCSELKNVEYAND